MEKQLKLENGGEEAEPDSVSTETGDTQEENNKQPGIFDKLARVGDVSGS